MLNVRDEQLSPRVYGKIMQLQIQKYLDKVLKPNHGEIWDSFFPLSFGFTGNLIYHPLPWLSP